MAFRQVLTCAAVLGAVSAFGDWLWTNYIPDGAVVPGVVHGVVIFVVLALVLGRSAGTASALRRLLVSLPIAGLLIAAGFYPLYYVTGYIGALLLTWVAMWLTLALLGRWARGGREAVRTAVVRAVVAAIGSGLAFWAISGIWTNPAPEPNYALRFLLWTFAFLPGFAALLLVRAER